jgi:hypothetical protein
VVVLIRITRLFVAVEFSEQKRLNAILTQNHLPAARAMVPVGALDTSQRKLRLVVFLTAGDQVLDVHYMPVEVSLLKN